MRDDITDMKSDLKWLKNDNENMKFNMKYLHDRHSSLAELIGETNQSVDLIKEQETIHLDVEHIDEQSAKNTDKIDTLEEEVKKIQIAQISSNIRIFGLDVHNNEQEHVIINKVVKHVLKRACPGEDWAPEDIKSARVIPVMDQSKVPMVIAKLRFDDDKFRVYKGRPELRKFGIRVGDDLTFRQREKLKQVRNSGQTGYYFKGKLHFRDETEHGTNNVTTSGVNGREIRRGNRHLTTDIDRLNDTVGSNEHSNMQTDSASINSNLMNVDNQK